MARIMFGKMQFEYWPGACDGCEAPIQVLSPWLTPGFNVTPGQMVRCTKCYCQGHIAQDIWGFYVEWPNDVCAKCYRDFDARLERLTHNIGEMIRHDRSQVPTA